jgi:hypothetical protein
MSAWLGYRNIDDLLTFAVNTHSASTGAATDADAVPSYRVYEDETGTAILTGSMAKLDDTNTTGFYSEQLTLSAANGFEAGKCYSIYISAAVNSVTGTTERHFSIWPAAINSTIGADVVKISGDSVAADNLESYTDGTTPMPVNATQISGDSTAADNLEAATDGTGYNLGAGQIVSASVTGAVGSVTGNVGGNVVGSVASVTGAVTVGTLNANVITSASINNGAIMSNKFQAGAITSSVLATDAITASNIAAGAITASEISTDAAQEIANAVWSANVDNDYAISPATSTAWANNTFGDRVIRSDSNNQAEVSITGSNHIAADIHEIQPDEIIDIAQGVLTEATSTTTYAAGDVGNVLGRLVNMIEADGADYRYTTNALEQAPSGEGGGGTAYATGNLPYQVKAEQQFPTGIVDIITGTLLRLDLQILDRDNNPINLTGTTVTVGLRNATTGATIGTDQSATLSFARMGMIYVDTISAWSSTVGTYRLTVSATVDSDVIVAGPLSVVVRSR